VKQEEEQDSKDKEPLNIPEEIGEMIQGEIDAIKQKEIVRPLSSFPCRAFLLSKWSLQQI
jgi:hypothetical protein